MFLLYTKTQPAERFEPDRWDTEEVKSRHKSSYLPFATGPRGCIDYKFCTGPNKDRTAEFGVQSMIQNSRLLDR